jgi:hypothetical protein
MHWQAPRYEEIKMDAEIGSYQADDSGDVPPYGDVGLVEAEFEESTGSSMRAPRIDACST